MPEQIASPLILNISLCIGRIQTEFFFTFETPQFRLGNFGYVTCVVQKKKSNQQRSFINNAAIKTHHSSYIQ